MASNITPSHAPDETREFVLAMVVAFATMVVVVLGTLYALGYLGPGRSADAGAGYDAPLVVASDDLTPSAKPTAVWKFRADWQKPAQP